MTEVWPVAADEVGLWLLSGRDAWRSDIIMADSSIHWETDLLLLSHGVDPDSVVTLHSTSATDGGAHWTSWRPDGTSAIHTHMAAIEPAAKFVKDAWPDACPITLELFERVKKPPTHGATEEPCPRWIDVLFHGLRHLRHLRDENAENAAALGPHWHQHLEAFAPALATMYSERHQPAA